MCQRIYIGSVHPLPSLERSRSGRPISILPLSPEASGIRRWFSKAASHFVEAHGSSPCGCGFPEVSEDRSDRPVSGDDRAAVHALASYLEQRPGRKCVAELLLCWVGDEGVKPSQAREIRLAALRAHGFRFRRGELLRVQVDGIDA